MTFAFAHVNFFRELAKRHSYGDLPLELTNMTFGKSLWFNKKMHLHSWWIFQCHVSELWGSTMVVVFHGPLGLVRKKTVQVGTVSATCGNLGSYTGGPRVDGKPGDDRVKS